MNTKDSNDYQRYIAARNEATHALRKARKEFEQKIAREAKFNNKSFWNYVNSRRSTRVKVADLRKSDGSFTDKDAEKAEILKEQYSSVFSKEDKSNIPPAKTRQVPKKFTLKIDRASILKKLQNLKTNKSPGPDQIHPRVLKETADIIVTPLLMLFNKSITSGVVPLQWKIATITPIYKKGNKADPANYRPVSLTSVVCKILERIVSEAIVAHIKSNHLACAAQHGFTEGKSTTTNLLEALDYWMESLSHDIPVDVLYLDYAKAFDTVPHERLLEQLSSFGLNKNYLQWIRSFLTGRKQRVMVNDTYSSWAPVTSGVPQGSVLGPLLFILFVSDIPEIIQNPVLMFADDTKVYSALEPGSEDNSLQEDLDDLQEWAQKMCMRFHPEKCKVMHLGHNSHRKKYHMTTSDGAKHTLEVTEQEKDLGVTIDSKLVFSKHVYNQVNKANRVLGAIKHTFKALDNTSFSMLYKSLVRPHLEYASTAWSPKLKRDKDTLEYVQRRATRLVQGISHLGYEERLESLKLPTLEFRRQRADVIQVFKSIKGLDNLNYQRECPTCKNHMLRISNFSSTRGHSLKLMVQHRRGPKSAHLGHRVVNNWNKLNQTTVDAETLNTFKSRLTKQWQNHPDLYSYRFSY
jgi:hypothetical protein